MHRNRPSMGKCQITIYKFLAKGKSDSVDKDGVVTTEDDMESNLSTVFESIRATKDAKDPQAI